jgi:2-phosphosulfolactate phosphatase
MRFHRVALSGCAEITGVAVVIDVLRAFSTACYAFAADVPEIRLVAGIDEAFALRAAWPGAALMGEEGGKPIPGFDYGNSPQPFVDADFGGRRLIQRTSHGTQGVARSVAATALVTTSFVCACATAAYLQAIHAEDITFVITGLYEGLWGDEDTACADYLQALLTEQAPDPVPYLARVYASPTGCQFADPAISHYPATDLPLCTALDRFDFAMTVARQDGLLRMTPVAV